MAYKRQSSSCRARVCRARSLPIGPADRGHDTHPETPGFKRCKSSKCGAGGVCNGGGGCACFVPYKGGYGGACSAVVKFPMGMSPRFTGNFVLNRRKLLETAGLFTVYQSRPLKSGAAGTKFSFSAAPELLKVGRRGEGERGRRWRRGLGCGGNCTCIRTPSCRSC